MLSITSKMNPLAIDCLNGTRLICLLSTFSRCCLTLADTDVAVLLPLHLLLLLLLLLLLHGSRCGIINLNDT